uniref:Uncharacterized protein n=1 Tax=Ciona savignyi TaxID=51511 RepID=H2YVC2_CIOSA
MACSGTACQAISKHSALRSVILALLADPDTQSLVETVRLLRICIANSNTADPWVESAAENAKDLLENSIFILNSSTNGKLLANLAEVLDQMFKYSEKILETFCDKNFIVALLEALEQLSKESNSLHVVCHPLHALHTVAETEKGRLVVVEQRRNIATALATLTEQWMNFHPKVAYESSTTMSSSEVSISCCLATASTIFESLDEDGEKLDDEDREMLIRFSKTVLAAKGVVTALAVLSSSAVTIPDEVEPPNEFKTPLVGHKNSPRVSTPLLTHTVKISGSITPSSTPKAVSEPDTPQHVENGTPI